MIITKELIEGFKQWVFSHLAADTAWSYAHYVTALCLGRNVDAVNTPGFLMGIAVQGQAEGWALSTIGNYTAGVKKFLKYMELFHGVEIFDLDKVKCKRPPKRDVNFLERNEVEKIRGCVRPGLSDLLDHSLFEFYLHTGCRASEGISLDWQDLDFERGEARVIGKGNKPRIVFLGGAGEVIQKYLAERKNTARPLFLTQYGTRLRRLSVHKRIRNLGMRAKLDRLIHPHLLRATFCTYLIRAGTDPKTVQELMGHEDLETTLRYYYAVTKDGMKEAHQNLEKYLRTALA